MTGTSSFTCDLVVLTADGTMQRVVETLFTDRQNSFRALRIRSFSYECRAHPFRDPGVFEEAADFLRLFLRSHRHAMVLLDKKWPGSPGTAADIVHKIQSDLNQNGWSNRSDVVVIEPELDIWMWADSPHVAKEVGWPSPHKLRSWLQANGLLTEGEIKPSEPKRAMELALEKSNTPISSSIYAHIARQVSLSKCTDPAFRKFISKLAAWFPI